MTGFEPRETRLKRLAMRSMRRGIKEMDVILSAYAQSEMPQLPDDALDAYEALLSENDLDLYAWVSGAQDVPAPHQPTIDRIKAHLAH